MKYSQFLLEEVAVGRSKAWSHATHLRWLTEVEINSTALIAGQDSRETESHEVRPGHHSLLVCGTCGTRHIDSRQACIQPHIQLPLIPGLLCRSLGTLAKRLSAYEKMAVNMTYRTMQPL